MEEKEKDDTLLGYVVEKADKMSPKKIKRWIFLIGLSRKIFFSKIGAWAMSWIPFIGTSCLFSYLLGFGFGFGDMLILVIAHMLMWMFKLAPLYETDALPIYEDFGDAVDFLKKHLDERKDG